MYPENITLKTWSKKKNKNKKGEKRLPLKLSRNYEIRLFLCWSSLKQKGAAAPEEKVSKVKTLSGFVDIVYSLLLSTCLHRLGVWRQTEERWVNKGVWGRIEPVQRVGGWVGGGRTCRPPAPSPDEESLQANAQPTTVSQLRQRASYCSLFMLPGLFTACQQKRPTSVLFDQGKVYKFVMFASVFSE